MTWTKNKGGHHMQTRYFKEYSPILGRDMECKVYGHAGRPVLFIPCQDGRYFDFENFHMDDVFAPWIESGQVMVIAIDTMDLETWSGKGEAYSRIRRHEQWMCYIVDEVVYRNSPVHYLSNMSPDHPYVAKYNRNQGIICVGQGAWEQVDTTRILDELFREKGINVWVDYWGHDVSHDWPWWYKQVAYFMPKLLEG